MLQQWGTIELTEEVRVWEQPVLTNNGKGGDELWCWCSHSTNNPPYKALDGDRTSSMITHEGQLTSGYTYFYFEILPNINISSLQFVQAADINTVTCTVEATPQFSDNGYTTLGTFSYSGVQNSISTFTFSEAQKNTNYHRFRITIPANHKPYHVYAYLGEVIINATYKVEASNSCIFPISFSNTFYSHSLGFESGSGLNSFVSNKTISGMEISNGSTDSNRVCWTTIGY